MLKEALDEKAVGIAAGIGSKRNADTRFNELLKVDFVDFEGAPIERLLRVLALFVAFNGLEQRQPLRREALPEERCVDIGRRIGETEHRLFASEGGDHTDIAALE